MGSPFFGVWRSKESASPARANTQLPALSKGKPHRQTNPQTADDEPANYQFNSYQRIPHKRQSQFNQNQPHPTPATPRSPAPTAATAAEHSRLLPPPRMAQRSHQHAQRLPSSGCAGAVLCKALNSFFRIAPTAAPSQSGRTGGYVVRLQTRPGLGFISGAVAGVLKLQRLLVMGAQPEDAARGAVKVFAVGPQRCGLEPGR